MAGRPWLTSARHPRTSWGPSWRTRPPQSKRSKPAGLNYQVELVPLFTQAINQVPRRQGVIRSDTNQILGTVGKGYTPIQNAEAFQFLDSVVADGGLRYHTAGALGQGEKIRMLAKLPGSIRVNGTEDITDKFLLLHNSHDGSSCLRVHFTPVRVVCQNTLVIAERNGRGQGISIMHKGNLESKVREAQKVLGLATRFYDDLQPKIDLLANCFPTQDQLHQFFRTLYPDPVDGNTTRAEGVPRWSRRQGAAPGFPGLAAFAPDVADDAASVCPRPARHESTCRSFGAKSAAADRRENRYARVLRFRRETIANAIA